MRGIIILLRFVLRKVSERCCGDMFMYVRVSSAVDIYVQQI